MSDERPQPAPRWPAYLWAAATVALSTAIGWPFYHGWSRPDAGATHHALSNTNILMLYLLGVLWVATRHGRGPAILASLLGVAAFDFCFVPPYLTFAVADTQYLVTFAVMLVVGLVISGLTVRIRLQAEAARQREQRTAALYAMSRELAEAGAIDDLVATAARHITEVFGAEVAVLLPDAEGKLQARRNEARFPLEENDLMLSRWAFEHRQPAGLGTAMSDAAHAVHLPLLGHRGPIGVVSVRPRRRDAFTTPEPLRP